MPVIINEFEVVSEAPPPEQAAETTQTAPPAAPGAAPYDIEKILVHLAERLSRLSAD